MVRSNHLIFKSLLLRRQKWKYFIFTLYQVFYICVKYLRRASYIIFETFQSIIRIESHEDNNYLFVDPHAECAHVTLETALKRANGFEIYLFPFFSLQFLQNLGKVDRTADDIFDEHLQNFTRQQNSANRLQKEFNNYIRCVRGKLSRSLEQIFPTFF